MGEATSLSEILQPNTDFKTSVNLYLSLNKDDKVQKYIPTKSSLGMFSEYLEAVEQGRDHATILIGSYGKGKSHFLLVLLALLTWERTDRHTQIISDLCAKISQTDEYTKRAVDKLRSAWRHAERFLPVIISYSSDNISHTFYKALFDALKREGLDALTPHTQYTAAAERIVEWKEHYAPTYAAFKDALKADGQTLGGFSRGLEEHDPKAMEFFKTIYPMLTAGSEFSPMMSDDVLSVYRETADLLKEEYGYRGIYIVFDEFSKFIEGQNHQELGANMKLLQDMCELAAESEHSEVFITFVAHKSIKEYGSYLAPEIINAFTGIEGRLAEKHFITSSKNNYELLSSAIHKRKDFRAVLPKGLAQFEAATIDRYYRIPVFESNFTKDRFFETVVEGAYPLNPLAAYLLIAVSEKVAQNERTLFTFVSGDEPYSLARLVRDPLEKGVWTIGADRIYDYFRDTIKKDVTNEYVHNQWLNAEYALTKCQTPTEEHLIKALAVIRIVNKEEEVAADENSVALAVQEEDVFESIEALLERKVLYRRGADGTLAFKTRAGIELKKQMKRRRDMKGSAVNYGKVLEDATGRYFLMPRRYNATWQMTRYFRHEYMRADDFLAISDGGILGKTDIPSDGKVITLYDFKRTDTAQIKEHFARLALKHLVLVVPKKKLDIEKQLRDFEIIQELKADATFSDQNEIQLRELPLLEEDIVEQIEKAIQTTYEKDAAIILIFDGENVNSYSAGRLEQTLNDCCERIYYRTPRINNEMVNRHRIPTAQTKKTRLAIMDKLLAHADISAYNTGTSQEATVYRSLFVQTGVLPLQEASGQETFTVLNNDAAEGNLSLQSTSGQEQLSMQSGSLENHLSEILQFMNEFIDAAAGEKQPLNEVIETLKQPPYGMREGVMPLYFAYILSKRNEDIVLYDENTEMPLTAELIVGMCEEPDRFSLFVSKEDAVKEKYIAELNRLFDTAAGRNLTNHRLKNIIICMQRWYRALPQATKNFADMGLYAKDRLPQMTKLHNELRQMEPNPYETLFIRLPEIFGAGEDYLHTVESLGEIKALFDGHFAWLEQRTAQSVREVFLTEENGLAAALRDWYSGQSENVKLSLQNGKIASFMTAVGKLNAFDDVEITHKLVRALSGIYMDSWTSGASDTFIRELTTVKSEIEGSSAAGDQEMYELRFAGKGGAEIKRRYSYSNNGEHDILRNMIEDSLADFDDISVNDRVGVLLEIIERLVTA